MQHEAYMLATLSKLKVKDGSKLDWIHDNVVFNNKKITPTFFSMLFAKIKIQDQQFHQLMRILSKSCSMMEQNHSQLDEEFFQSEIFFQQFITLGKLIDELWILKRKIPAEMQEWKLKQRQIFHFRSKLLKCLEKTFGKDWVKDLVKRAKLTSVERVSLDRKWLHLYCNKLWCFYFYVFSFLHLNCTRTAGPIRGYRDIINS